MSRKKRITHDIDQEYLRIREWLWEQKGRTCIYCGKPAEEFHHIVPRHMGGDNRLSNIVPLCRECHSKAHSKRNNEKEWKAGRHLLPIFGEALKKVGTTKNTFYRFLREYREETGDTRCHKNQGNRKSHTKRA